MRIRTTLLACLFSLPALAGPIRPAEVLPLFNGTDLSSFYTFIKERGRDSDPKQVFTVVDGAIRVSGEEWGCITTHEEYADYHLVAEFRWGPKAWPPREKAARDNGILLHSTGEDGGYSGTWMHSIECQLIEGGTGDMLVVGDGSKKFALTVSAAPEKQGSSPVFQPGGKPETLHSGRANWWGRDPAWEDVIDFRGSRDVEHPVGQWNRLECIARGDTVRILLNGVLVNEAFHVKPKAGRLQIQSEGAEIFFRRFELHPLDTLPDPVSYPKETSLLEVLQPDGSLRRAETAEAWQPRRNHILGGFHAVIGPLTQAGSAGPLDVQTLSEEDKGAYTLRKVSYLSGPEDRVTAWLLLPKGLSGKASAVLCLHQTIDIGKDEPAGLGENGELDYARELAERGYVTLAPDYPTFGENQNQPETYTLGYDSITAKGIWNHMRAVDVLQSLPEVDPGRIGCIGHSLGGHNTLFLAALDTRIKAAVSSCGFDTFPTYYNGDLRGWAQYRYMPRIETLYELKPARMPFDFDGILAAIAPRGVFVSAPTRDANFNLAGTQSAISRAREVFSLHGVDDKLVAIHPDAEHSFPAESREAAYAALDTWLRD